jgi:hypothetical protein
MKKHLFRDILFVMLLIALVMAYFLSPFKPSLPPLIANKPLKSPPAATSRPTLSAASASLNVSGSQWGKSTCYIGATEGSSRFAIADMRDLGINAYHIYGGMSRWEPTDDNKVYGTPSITQIEANPNVINWTQWDTAMTHPPNGSDYWWVNASPEWKGNARTIFGDLQSAGIRPILDLRNRDDQNDPSWSPNPPTTTADWNEWWGHVFSLVYWLDVRNHYNVNDFEVQNEPDSALQGWHGTQQQYELFVQYTNDAIDFVYKNYLPGHTYHLYGPSSLGKSTWPVALMQQGIIDSVDIHNYSSNISPYVEQVHSWMRTYGYTNQPLWLSEWGSVAKNAYSAAPMGISLLNNLIRGSSPGNDYVYGSTVFSLYDYATYAFGFISANGTRRLDYYALRMGIRALQGCHPTYQSITSNKNLLSITTRNTNGSYSLLITNQSPRQPYTVDAKLSALALTGNGTLQRFDARDLDTNNGSVDITNGHTTITIPPNGAVMLTFTKSAS